MSGSTPVVFNMKKGDQFSLEKGFARIHVGSFWEELAGGKMDIDVHAIGLIHPQGDAQRAHLYNGGTHALTYANTALDPVMEDGAKVGFRTSDDSMHHSVDNRRGGNLEVGREEDSGHDEEEQISEEMMFQLPIVPAEVAEIAIWATIHEAQKRKQDFSMAPSFYVEVCDPDDTQLCQYQPKGEFAGMSTLQVASIMRNDDGGWDFVAIGAGSRSDLGAILAGYGA